MRFETTLRNALVLQQQLFRISCPSSPFACYQYPLPPALAAYVGSGPPCVHINPVRALSGLNH